MIGPPSLTPGISATSGSAAECGCCNGNAPRTPLAIFNRPGLQAVSYRPGRYGDFKRSQLAQLSTDRSPALSKLKSRDDGDFTVALIEAWSCVCDVLTFYQERNANEAWLGTATERRSIVELGRPIGYRLRPGLAAATDLVFLMDDPPGAAAAVRAVDIPAGTKVRSIPGPGETAQTFETIQSIEARVAWNALQPRQTKPSLLVKGSTEVWLKGAATGLKAGDLVLFIGAGRAESADPSQAKVRQLTQVESDPATNRTRIEWEVPLEAFKPSETEKESPKVYALRARAALFGWNAPHPNLLSNEARTRYNFKEESIDDWSFSVDAGQRQIFLDTVHEGFVPGSWIVIVTPQSDPKVYRINVAQADGRSDYAVSARVTRLTLDTNSGLAELSGAAYRAVTVYGSSEELPFAETPICGPVTDSSIELSGHVEGLADGRRLIVRGRRAQIVVREYVDFQLRLDAPPIGEIAPGMRLTVLQGPVQLSPGYSYIWHVRTAGGQEGFVFGGTDKLTYVAADATTEIIAESARVSDVSRAGDYSKVSLAEQLTAFFDRASTVVHANVAPATDGETTQEIIGNGDAARPFQTLHLRQAPLTYIAAANQSGGASSTLRIRASDIEWREVLTLYGQSATAQVFETRIDDDGTVIIQFGDGVNGARPPTGRNNLVATYRKGIGVSGSVAAGTLTTALDVPLGLREVFNPLPARGGQDPETLDDARTLGPTTTLALGRAVSLRNYEDFARSFAGIAKARADMLWDKETRRIVVTVAGPAGEPVGDELKRNLIEALQTSGDPFVPISVVSYRQAFFQVAAHLFILPDHDQNIVLAACAQALRNTYSFERRGFLPLVAASEVVTVIHSVPGVEGVRLGDLSRKDSLSGVEVHSRLLADPVRLNADGTVVGAEILMLEPSSLVLEHMS